jgi:hypothetical protein
MSQLALLKSNEARLIAYRPWSGDPWLIGHADIDFDGWIIHRIPIFRRKNGELSVGVPDTVVLHNDGSPKEIGGRLLHAPLISFSSDEAKARWRSAVLTALAAGGAP